MGMTKSTYFTAKQNKLAAMMKALGHPARIAIIEHLLKSKECICGDIVTEIGLAQATISQHLKELKNVGLIKGSIEGTSVCYCIDARTWAHYQKLFEAFFDEKLYGNDCC
jgi:DNA-binding transcriptional ArsR family regulator